MNQLQEEQYERYFYQELDRRLAILEVEECSDPAKLPLPRGDYIALSLLVIGSFVGAYFMGNY